MSLKNIQVLKKQFKKKYLNILLDHVLYAILIVSENIYIDDIRSIFRSKRSCVKFHRYILSFVFFFFRLTFFVTTVMTTAILISDRHEGVWERSIVQGKRKCIFNGFNRELFKKICALKRILCAPKLYNFFIKNNKYLALNKPI